MAHAGESRFWAAYGRALANPLIGCPVSLAVLAVNIALILSSRMWAQSLETSVEKLWVNPTSEAGRNLNYTNRWAQDAQGSEVELITMRDPVPGTSAATFKHVNNMYAVTKRVRDFVVTVNGTDYTTLDVCAGRAALPSYVAGCSAYSIMDYFYEGREYASDQGMAQFLLDSRLAYPATSYHLAWAATADVLQGGGYTFGKLFDDQCVTNGYLFCHEKPTYTLPSPYNVNTVGVGKGALFNQVYELASLAGLPDQIRFESAFIKAKGVLAGMMQQSRVGPVPSCATWTAAINTQVPGASNLPTDWDLTKCGYDSSGTCSGNDCTISQLTALKTGDFSTSCGKCVGALMFWLRDYTNNKMVSATNAHPGTAVPGAGPLATWAVYTAPTDTPATTKPAQLDLFNFGAAATAQFRLCPVAAPDSVLKRVKLPQCLGMWTEAYNARKLYAAGNTDGFFSRMTTEFRAWAALTTPPPTTLAAIPYYDFSNDTLDGIALMDSTTNTTKTARDTAWRSVIAADIVTPVRTILNRHYNRASFKNVTDKAIINTLSGVNNDFSILQNATRIVFGGPKPDPNFIRGGQCKCKPGYSGDRCKVPVDDGVCDCGSDDTDLFPRSCTTDAVGKCIPFAPCAGNTETITRMLSLQATLFPQLDTTNFYNARAAATGLTADYYKPRETDAVFRSYCEAQLPCFENAPGSYPAFFPPSFAPALTDAGYFTAHSRDLKDYPTLAFQWRAEQLLRLVNGAQASSGPAIRAALNAVLTGLLVGDEAALAACTLGANCNMGVSLATPFAAGPSTCPLYTTGTITTLLDYMSCVVDIIHGSTAVGHLNPRNAQGVALWSNAGGSKTCSFSTPGVDSGYFTASVCNGMIANRAAIALWKLLDKGTIRVSALVSGVSSEPTDMTFDMHYNATLAWGTRMSGEWPAPAIRNVGPPGSTRRTNMENIVNSVGSLTPTVNAYLGAQCSENSIKYPRKLMNLAGNDCGTLFQQLPDATNTNSPTISAPAKLNITVSLVKYKLVGVVLGSCTMDAFTKLRGGAACFTDVDCNGPTGGTCVGLENNRTYDSIAAFGWIMFTRSLKGLQALNFDGVDQQRYREIANRPILDRYYAANPNLTRSNVNVGPHTLSPEAIKAVQAAWHVKLADLVAKSDNIDGTLTTALSTATVSDVVAQYSEADFRLIVIGYFLMILYAVLSLSSPSSNVKAMLINSRGMVAGAGIVLIAISVASGLGVTALAGYKWSAAATQILPYVMLGLGVNDVFVICRTFPMYREGLSAEEATAQGIGMVGNAVFLVNFTNSCIFAIAILTGMPVIVVMAVQACIITVANFVTELAILPYLLSLDYRRQGRGHVDCLPCGPSIASKEELLGMSAAVASKESEGRVARNCFNTCCVPRYASFILSKPMKVVVVVLMMGLLVAGAAGVGANVQLGLSLADLAPSGSQLQKSLEIRDNLFPFYTFYVAFPEVDYSDREVQQGMYDLVKEVNELGKVMDDSGITWIKAMILWALPTGLPNYDLTTNERPCDIASPTTQGNCGSKFNCVIQFTHPSVYDDKKNPFFAKQDFYRCLNKWLNTDSNYASLSPGFVLKDPTAPRGQREVYFSTNDTTGQKLPYSQTTFFAQGLNTNDDFVTLIHQTSLITGSTTTPPSYAGGSPIAFWDQYVSLKGLINQSIGLGLAICFVVVSCTVIFTADYTGGRERVRRVIFIGIWTGALVTGTVCATVFTLYGFMTYANLKISSIPAISIIMSLGADLSFAAYIAMSFLNFSGTRDDRVRGALDVMLAPALDGGVTILLGVVLLAFSPLLFIVRYFFLVWLLIVVFGLSFSFIALPVVLSLVGPPSLVLERSEDLKA